MLKINAGYSETHAMLKIIPQVGGGVSTTGGWGVEILISSRCLCIPGSWDHSFRRMILISSRCLRILRIPGSRARSCRRMDNLHSARSCSRTPKQYPGSTTVTINGLVYMALGSNDFDASKSISRATGRGGPWQSGPTLYNGPSNGLPPIKILNPRAI
jgi:hypothetical protein